METAFEKVCPVCGNGASLESKYCSGCGHEYRTVFHEKSAPVTTDGATESSFFDSRWAPVLAVIPVLFVIIAMRTAGSPTTADVSTPAAVTSAADNVESMQSLLNTGMSADDVKRMFGTAGHVDQAASAAKGETWYYVRSGKTLEIHFNSALRVDSVRTYGLGSS